MGGDWIPESFVPIEPDPWRVLAPFVDPSGFYRCACIQRKNPTALAVWDGEREWTVAVSDKLIELFQLLKDAGDTSVIIADRLLRRCWITDGDSAHDFMNYHIREQEAEYDV